MHERQTSSSNHAHALRTCTPNPSHTLSKVDRCSTMPIFSQTFPYLLHGSVIPAPKLKLLVSSSVTAINFKCLGAKLAPGPFFNPNLALWISLYAIKLPRSMHGGKLLDVVWPRALTPRCSFLFYRSLKSLYRRKLCCERDDWSNA